jgi:hypothetical protein
MGFGQRAGRSGVAGRPDRGNRLQGALTDVFSGVVALGG